MRLDDGRTAGRAARQPDLSPARLRRPDPRRTLHLGRPRLSGCRAGAFLAQGHGPREVRRHHGQGGARRLSALHAARGHHPGARTVARARVRRKARADAAARQHPRHESLRPRRQGHLRRRQASWDEYLNDFPHRPALRRAEDQGAEGARDVHHGGRSRSRDECASSFCTRQCRRRYHRTRHAVLRSHGRRARRAGRRCARAESRPDDAEDAGARAVPACEG